MIPFLVVRVRSVTALLSFSSCFCFNLFGLFVHIFSLLFNTHQVHFPHLLADETHVLRILFGRVSSPLVVNPPCCGPSLGLSLITMARGSMVPVLDGGSRLRGAGSRQGTSPTLGSKGTG